MFDRAVSSVIAAAAACAAVGVAVVAAGFALYALVQPHVGAAGAAAVVAGIAALGVGIYAVVAQMQAKAREREAASAHSQLLESMPHLLGEISREHPIITVAVSALGGLLAARNPQLTREVLSVVAAFTSARS
ncbi:MAG: hypothetical protein WDM79_13880 [Terricaulis sp.]